MARTFAFWGVASFVSGYGYFHEWAFPLFCLAPAVGLVFLLVCLTAVPILTDARAVCILPYFKKGVHPDLARGDTFVHGKALARNSVYLDALAQQYSLQPLSSFGFADDLHGETPVWHEAHCGLKTVSGLLKVLEEQPYLLEDAHAIMDDLGRIEGSLYQAHEYNTPFCLLLRIGNSASGHEMDVRAGYFAYNH